MTEQEWLSSNDPVAMFYFLTVTSGQKPSSSKHVEQMRIQRGFTARKSRLFACSRVYAMSIGALNDTTCRKALDMAERVADGNSHDPKARDRIINLMYNTKCFGSPCAVCLTRYAVRGSILPNTLQVHGELPYPYLQANLIRDIFGNPYREVRPIEWIVPDVYSLAKAAYDEREGDGKLDETRLSILADALEDDGCYPLDEQIVIHLRSAGPHYRGMWSLDIVRGLE